MPADSEAPVSNPPRHATRRRRWPIGIGVFVLAIAILIAVWQWDWFIPLVDAQASAALGRKVTIQHLHVHLGGTTLITADGVRVESPPGFPADQPLATMDHLTVGVRPLSYLHGRLVDIPLIAMDHPVVNAIARPDGTANWTATATSNPSQKPSTRPPPRLGVLRIEDGHVHVQDPHFKTDMNLLVHTTGEKQADGGRLLATASGTYAHQPITGRFAGGALLQLRDRAKPYPIDLHVANGPTTVTLKGEVDQPLTFGGARLKLVFQGPDMALLLPLTGVPIPHTPPFKVTGNLDYQKSRIVFDHFRGTVGASDLGGRIAVEPEGHVPDVQADLVSTKVDLNDLAGFIGSTPGSSKKHDASPAQQREISKSRSSGDILPEQTFSVPKLRAANVHLKYKGAKIENRFVPLDNIVVGLDIVDGRITLHPLDFGVGSGTITSNAELDPAPGPTAGPTAGHETSPPASDEFRTKAHVTFRNVDLSRVMQATHAFKGQGVIGGQADLSTTGNSVATLLGNGNGGATLIVSGHGDISALLHDIAGLEVGNAILSALGLPNRAELRCFVADMPLKDGILSMRTFLLQTSEARSIGRGTIDLRDQTLDYSLTTRSTHFSVGSLPGPINVTGKLGSPTIRPGAEVIARAGAAAGLGVLLAPLAILPTVQLGVGEGACTDALREARQDPAAPPAATKVVAHPARSHHR